MERPAVTEQDHVADSPVDNQPVEKLRPFGLAAAKIDRSGKPPKHAIATVEIPDRRDGREREAPGRDNRRTAPPVPAKTGPRAERMQDSL